ncbi:MAG: hypothetical protein HZB11_01825 [Candidatus Yonathbacteria bacterium]|nr:hypothetical protein [Candidatus Yonathbacteria bacterium]
MTSIQEITEKIKGYTDKHRLNLQTIPNDLFLGLIIVLVAFGAFGLGRLSKIEGSKTPVRFENMPETTADTFSGKIQADTQNAPAVNTKENGGQLVGSKGGTKYYYTWCTGVQKIAETNRIYFASKAEAESSGYTPSATCKGL